MNQCCYHCFKHRWLKGIIHEAADKVGTCKFCGAISATLADVNVLNDSFDNLLSMYTPLSAGEVLYPWEDPLDVGDSLITLIQDDWQVFSDTLIETDRALDLMRAVQLSCWEKDSGEDLIDAGDLYTRRRSIYHTPPAQAWEWYCEGVKENPESDPEFYEFLDEELCRVEVMLKEGTILHRARPGFNPAGGTREPWQGRMEIGAPFAKDAKPSRAWSGKGKVPLYCAEQEWTTVCEKKQGLGEYISICEVRVLHDLRIVDLAEAIPLLNPFTSPTLSYEVEIVNLLNSYAGELSRPLEDSDDKTGYIPCQKLSEYIREAHFDGVRHSSAANPDGSNIFLFDPDVADILDSKLVRVINGNLEYEIVNGDHC